MPWTSRARTEFMARRYLASRGGAPMVADPLDVALPRLRQEVALCQRLARMDLIIALVLVMAALTVILTAWLAPLHGGIVTVLLWLHAVPLLGLGAVVWGAIMLEKTTPRWVVSRRIARALQAGAWLEALDLAVHGLPAPAAQPA
ncbi:hypothetical protein [Pseudoroseomonas cervicalis]|uniref:hypothetical protein n=1 Tax=Teichococcus cervicalis TaxID=204525 RepID=UPI0022F1C272|nr:hypothetical protein [Pseudoroseomonas cervicalis]WBV44507.1 hypothetical protein PFY06_08105 [Pseudoroseomonas cervicalis]